MLYTYEATPPHGGTSFHFGPFVKGRGVRFERRLRAEEWTNIRYHQLNAPDMELEDAELSYSDGEGYEDE